MEKRSTSALALVALLAATPVLAGCLGTAQATAKEHESTAEDRAHAWADDPRLVEAVGVEGSFPTAFGPDAADLDQRYWERAREDPDLGDGHAEIWVYRFIAEQAPGTVLTVVVDRDGEIVTTHRDDRGADDQPLGTWELDSEGAVQIAREANQGLEEGTSKEHFGLVMRLGHDEDHANPVWLVSGGGGDRSGGGGGAVLVDAVTGEVLESHGGASGQPAS